MAIVVEDGSQVAGANSYASVADLRAYAALRGVTSLPADPGCEPLLIQACDYIEAQRRRYRGMKTAEAEYLRLNPSVAFGCYPLGTAQAADQALQWPRRDVWIDNRLLPDNVIPREVVAAQLALAVEASAGTDLMPTRTPTDPGAVVSEEVGPIKIAYANNGRVLATSVFAKAEALLAPLYKAHGLFVTRA